MINIREDTPNRISGITSLFVLFTFKQEIVNTIKRASKYAYDKKTHTWELPINCLAYLLDNLTYLDDITLELKKEADSGPRYIPKCEYKSKPFQHQLEAVSYGLNKDGGWLLLDQPGLGKSASMIYLAQELKEQRGLEHCLIICGVNTLKSNWRKEIKIHSNLSCRIIGEKVTRGGKVRYGSMKERAAELMNPIDAFFLIINIESIRNDDIVQALKKTKNKIDMIVIDEIHRCGSSSQQGHNLLKLDDFKHKIGLTGTLLVNSPLSAYLPLKWIGVEKATLTDFKGQYCEFGGFGGHQVVGYKNLDILKDVIDVSSLRRVKDLLNIPPKTIIKEVVEMNEGHQKFYDNICNGIAEECNKIEIDVDNALSMITRLRQATVCPSILSTEDIISSKIQRAVELVEDIISQGEKVVIISSFKEPVRILAERLKSHRPLVGTGDYDDKTVSENIDKFQGDDEHKVFICTYAKAGVGITLNAATYMICLDQRFTASDNEQAQDRIHRVNNTRPVFIYYLICQNTFDEVVDQICQTKEDLSDYIVDNKLNTSLRERLKKYISDI